MRKNKVFYFISAAVVILVLLAISIFYKQQKQTQIAALDTLMRQEIADTIKDISTDKSQFYQLGEVYRRDAEKLNTDAEPTIYFQGKNATVTLDQYIRVAAYYIVNGNDTESALALATDFTQTESAYYREAIRRGYAATEEEARNYVCNVLKSDSTIYDNDQNYLDLVEGFGSEEAYWEYECKIYKELLPQIKLNEVLEKEFTESEDMDTGKAFEKWFSDYKAQLVENEHFAIR